MKKVTIIGAGLSGIYLASLLEKEYEVTILEARDRVGGRVFSIDSHDLGPSWIWSHQKNILQLINSLGLELFSQHTKGYALYDAKDKVELFNTPPSAPSARMKGSLTQLINAIKDRLTHTDIVLNTEVVSIKEIDEIVKISTCEKEYEADYVITTLAPRLAVKLDYEPELPSQLKSQMLQTRTWMGNSAKCVIEFKTAFWKTKGLSGFVFSHRGPLGEMHDASLEDRPALFGFVSANADMQTIKEDVKKQLIRLFEIDKDEIVNIYVVNWRQERYSASPQDSAPVSQHPKYGIDTATYSQKILFSTSEFSFEEGGYLEGSIINAQKIASKLNDI